MGMCLQNFTEIACCVHDLRHFVQNGALLQTLEDIFSQSGWNIRNLKDPFRLMTIEILCTDLRDFGTKSVGVLSKNVFCTNRPPGGAITGPCEKFGAEVLLWYPGNVCAQFGCEQANGAGD